MPPIDTDARTLGGEDAFERDQLAKRIADLLRAPNSSAFVAAIYGKWGSGKTTVINWVGDYLKKHKYVEVVEVNPWLHGGELDLTSELLAAIVSRLRGRDGLTRKGISVVKKYTVALAKSAAFSVGVGPASVSFSGGDIAKDLAKRERALLLAAKAAAIEELNRIKKKVVVLLDDLDRLDESEVRSTLRLIRAGLDLPGVVFLVGADPELLKRALGKASSDRTDPDALEKLVQAPFYLPRLGPDQLADFLSAKMQSLAAALRSANVDISPTDWEETVDDARQLLIPLTRTPRDLVLLRNGLLAPLVSLASEASPADIVLVTAVQLWFPKVYELLWARRHVLLGLSGQASDEWIQQAEQNAKSDELRKEFLDVDSTSRKPLEALLHRLFPMLNGMRYQNEWSVRRRICAGDYLEIYFRWTLGRRGVSERVLEQIVGGAARGFNATLVDQARDAFQPERAYTFVRGLRIRQLKSSSSVKAVVAKLLSTLLSETLAAEEFNGEVVRELLRNTYGILSEIEDPAARANAARSCLEDDTLSLYVRSTLLHWLGREEGDSSESVISDEYRDQLGRSLAEQIAVRFLDAGWRAAFPKKQQRTLLECWSKYGDRSAVQEFVVGSIKSAQCTLAEFLWKFVSNWIGSDKVEPRREFDKYSLQGLKQILNPDALVQFIPESAKQGGERVDQRYKGLKSDEDLLKVFALAVLHDKTGES